MVKRLTQLATLGLIVISLIPLITILNNPLNVNADIAYFVDPALRILAGQLPYVDFFNVNLLTIQYLYVIPVIISDITGFHAVSIWMLITWLQMIISMYLSYRFVKIAYPNTSPMVYLIVPYAIGIVSWVMLFTVDVGQREHLFMLYVVPWLLLRYVSWEGLYHLPNQRTKFSYFVFGVMVAIVASIKPYFVLVILLLEVYGLIRYRNFRKLLIPETYGFITFSILNIVFLIINPDILSGMLDTIRTSVAGYENYKQSTTSDLLNLQFQTPVLISLSLFVVSIIKNTKEFRLLGGLSMLSIGGALLVILQAGANGYYHIVLYAGTLMCIGFMIVISLIQVEQSPSHIYTGFALFLFSLLFVGLNTWGSWQDLTTIRLKTPKDLQTIVQENSEAGDDVLFLTANLGDMMPWLKLIDRNQASSYMGTWLLVFLQDISADDTMLQQFADHTRNDISQLPSLIIVDTAPRSHVLEFLEQFELDHLIYSQYRLIGQVESYKVYAYFDAPPPQGIEFYLDDDFVLYSWLVDDQIIACEEIDVTTWWRQLSGNDSNPYSIYVDLIHEGDTIAESSGRLGDLQDYSSQSDIIDSRQLQIPCDLDAGDYTLLISIENVLIEEDPLSVVGSDNSAYGQYVFLTSFTVQEE